MERLVPGGERVNKLVLILAAAAAAAGTSHTSSANILTQTIRCVLWADDEDDEDDDDLKNPSLCLTGEFVPSVQRTRPSFVCLCSDYSIWEIPDLNVHWTLMTQHRPEILPVAMLWPNIGLLTSSY